MSRDYIKVGLFAYELVKSVSQSIRNRPWHAPQLNHYKSVIGDSGFHKKIGDAIFQIINHNYVLTIEIFEDLDESSHIPKSDFTSMALDALPDYFPEGYTPKHFLGFCSVLIGVVLIFLEAYGCDGVLKAAADVIQIVLIYFMLISDFDLVRDLPELIKVSEHCYHKLRVIKKK